MLQTEKRAAFSLALVHSFRLLGLFMILPVFSLHAPAYEGATPVLIGLAIGIYGLTQGLFQLPFGFLSDRIGRKTVIVGGLLFFCAGSILAAEAETINQVIAGRALQGMGAIAAAVMALAADLTREEMRIRVMAIIGISIGFSFMLAMILGPVIAAGFGLRSLFWLTAGLALLGILVVLFVTPQAPKQGFHRDVQLSIRDIGHVISEPELLKLGFGVFVLHLVLAATFVVFPLLLQQELMVAEELHWRTYLPVFVLSIAILVPLMIFAEKMRKVRAALLIAIGMMVLAELGLVWSESYGAVFVVLVLFFGGLNFLEAILPASVSRVARADMKGTALGLYSSAQFFGAFCGGLAGGALQASGNHGTVFASLAAILCLWFLLAWTMKVPAYVKSKVVSLESVSESDIEHFVERVRAISGVKEVSVYAVDRVAYLKVDTSFDDEELQTLLCGSHP